MFGQRCSQVFCAALSCASGPYVIKPGRVRCPFNWFGECQVAFDTSGSWKSDSADMLIWRSWRPIRVILEPLPCQCETLETGHPSSGRLLNHELKHLHKWTPSYHFKQINLLSPTQQTTTMTVKRRHIYFIHKEFITTVPPQLGQNNWTAVFSARFPQPIGTLWCSRPASPRCLPPCPKSTPSRSELPKICASLVRTRRCCARACWTRHPCLMLRPACILQSTPPPRSGLCKTESG